MGYYAIRNLHIACVIASGSLFLLRGLWMLAAPSMLSRRWVLTLPHLVDTALLTSAVTLAVLSRQYPFAQDWLGAKVIALLLYIGLGAVALRRRQPWAFVAALAVFGYIVCVAVTKQVVPSLTHPFLTHPFSTTCIKDFRHADAYDGHVVKHDDQSTTR